MTHYGTRSKTKPRRVEDEWLTLNTQVGDVVNLWARRNDIVTYIGKDGGQGVAAAFYDPTTYEVEVNTDIAFGKHVTPPMVGDFTERAVQFEWVQASGLMLHEAMHARFSVVSVPAVDKAIRDRDVPQDILNYANEAYTLMEELRIEYNGMQLFPKNRAFLRASALMLVTPEPEDAAKMNPITLALRVLLLGVGRVDALVLEKDDVRPLRIHTDAAISAADRKALRKIWRQFIELSDRRPAEFEKMIDLSLEWAEIEKRLRDKYDEENPKPEDGKGELSEGEQALMDALMDALGKAGDMAEMKAETEGQRQRAQEREEQAQKEREEEGKEQKENETVASKVFGHERSKGHNGNRSRSGVVSKREPNGEEREVAFKVAKALKKAKYRDRLVTQKRVEVPPGRLRTGAAMQADAAKAVLGRNIRVDAFKQTRRQHIEDPNLTVGMMCDISGSMGGAMRPMAVATWVMSEAVRKVKGKIAATYFGQSAFSVLDPGQHLTEIVEYGATDMHEAFDEGFRALDGALKLLQSSGARLLIIASDGQFKYGEEERVKHWLKRCKSRGVAVIWLSFKDGHMAKSICDETGASYVEVGTKIVEAADIIGKACQDALTNARTS